MSLRTPWTLISLSLLLVAGATSARSSPTDTATIVVDMQPSDEKDPLNRSFVFGSLPGGIKGLADCVPETGGDLPTGCYEKLREALDKEATVKLTTNRITAGNGDTVDIWVVYNSSMTSKPTVHIEEIPRKTRLASDLSDLFALGKKLMAPKSKAVDLHKAFKTQYRLTRTRATLAAKIQASPKPKAKRATGVGAATESVDSSRVEAKVEDEDETADGTLQATVTVITGPQEHWYLSADLPVNKVSELKYDTESGTVQSKSTPTTFYASANFLLGDVLDDRRSWWGNIAAKGLIRASSKPLEGFGFGLGYRLPTLRGFGFELDTFSPFVGHLWTEQDAAPASGSTEPQRRRVGKWVVGISLNLDKALGWLE